MWLTRLAIDGQARAVLIHPKAAQPKALRDIATVVAHSEGVKLRVGGAPCLKMDEALLNRVEGGGWAQVWVEIHGKAGDLSVRYRQGKEQSLWH